MLSQYISFDTNQMVSIDILITSRQHTVSSNWQFQLNARDIIISLHLLVSYIAHELIQLIPVLGNVALLKVSLVSCTMPSLNPKLIST